VTEYKIIAERHGSTNGMDWEAEYEITFLHTVKGAAPYFDHINGGDPGWPDEFEVVAVKPVIGVVDAGAFTDLAQRDLERWAYDWLHDEGYHAAVKTATECEW
jgi:hypothetical protein